MQAVCQRVRDGEAFKGYFFKRQMDYVFIGDYKYWFMADADTIKAVLDDHDTDQEVVLNRARLYHDRFLHPVRRHRNAGRLSRPALVDEAKRHTPLGNE